MIVVDMPRLFERPRRLVLAFMAGLSYANNVSARCYVEKLTTVLATERDGTVS